MNCLLNIDLGELAIEPDELYRLADIANIACGGHAGDDTSMVRALALCKQANTAPGAHPAYPDRQNFGRTRLDLSPEQLRRIVAEQCAELAAHAVSAGIHLHYMKPHGALYHAANAEPALAAAVISGAQDALGTDFCVIGPAHGALQAAAQAAGLRYAREGFADRSLRADGSLVPRSEPGALIENCHIAQLQAIQLADSGEFDTLCVHGDSPNALSIARAVRAALDTLAGSLSTR